LSNELSKELNKDLPYGSTPYEDDISGLKLKVKPSQILTRKDVYIAEAENIRKVIMKYLTDTPTKEIAPFNLSWMLQLHKEMYYDVWDWAGTVRKTDLSLGVDKNQIFIQLRNLCDDIIFWENNNYFDLYEIAAKIHYNAVRVHPFLNGNGRWSRMLSNIYLMQNDLNLVKWNENELAKNNDSRKNYIDCIKKADEGDFKDFFKLHKNVYSNN
jgi:Fic-DOC domain mobile mystery protein B